MIVGIMQPYFFPYIGYFQLMKAVDVFVFYDDVQYSRGGWVNRNRILSGGHAHWITFPVLGAPLHFSINERMYVDDLRLRGKVINIVDANYRRAPFFDDVFDLFSRHMRRSASGVAEFNQHSLIDIARVLGIGCDFVVSSKMIKNDSLRGQERVVEICRQFRAEWYINAIGGTELYHTERFAREGIDLRFHKARPTPYPQFGHDFVPFLSIIDVMMFNGAEGAAKLLCNYDLLTKEEILALRGTD